MSGLSDILRLICDKARIASLLNSFKNDPLYTHLVTSSLQFFYGRIFNIPGVSKKVSVFDYIYQKN